MDEEKQVGKILKMFSERLPLGGGVNTSRWGTVETSGLPTLQENTICHAGFRVSKGTLRVASNFDVLPGYEEAAEIYWDFMTSQNSPWRKVFEDKTPEKIFARDGTQSGFWLDGPTAYKNTRLTKNFCIGMRMIHERPDTIKDFATFVEKGVPPYVALPMSADVRVLGDLCTSSFGNQGSHWPIDDDFSFKKFRDGDAKDSNSSPFGDGCLDFSFDKMRAKKKPGRFSDKNFYDLDETIETYKKYAGV